MLIAYVTPGRTIDGFAFVFDYPFGFFTMNNAPINAGDSILNSTLFNIVGFALNILVIYFVIHLFNRTKSKKTEKDNIN